ncbi:MAG TPA: Xaa-Pro peptidase family protein [Gaiellaceae bacterium]|nr:Xaa-Pro peptidase family protein [Gaiellaceae bacterium]
MSRAFSDAEMRGRAERARTLMEERELDALVVSGDFSAGMNYYWLSGHMPRDFQQNYSRPHVMVLPLRSEPFLYVYDVNVENARDESWVEDVAAYMPPFDGAALGEVLRERGLDRGRLGLELGEDQRLLFPALALTELSRACPGLEPVDAAELIWRLRMLKSEAEVAYIAESNRINGDALAAAFAAIRAGDDELEIARVVGRSIVDAGAVRPPYAQLNVLTEAKSRARGGGARLLGPLRDYSLAEGDLLFVDSGAVTAGYWGEFGRMASVGPPTEAKRAHHDAIRSIVRRSIDESLVAGTTFEEVVQHLVRLYREHGYGEEQYGPYVRTPPLHYSHGVGLAGSEPPFVRNDSRAVLEPGMVITPEAYLSVDGVTYASEEDVLVTADGPRILSPLDEGLFGIR